MKKKLQKEDRSVLEKMQYSLVSMLNEKQKRKIYDNLSKKYETNPNREKLIKELKDKLGLK